MSSCLEIAIFKVPKDNIPRVIELSLSIIDEINSQGKVITSHHIFKKVDDEQEVCWHLTWVSIEKVKFISEKWSSFSSTKELESLVDERIYFGHFIDLA